MEFYFICISSGSIVIGYVEDVRIREEEDARIGICHCNIDILVHHQRKEISSN
jgi:hypothetical protein